MGVEKFTRRKKAQVETHITFTEAMKALHEIVNFHRGEGNGHEVFTQVNANALYRLGRDIEEMVDNKPTPAASPQPVAQEKADGQNEN